LLVAAGLLWPRGEAVSGRASYTAVAAVALNPATAVLWLSLAPLAHLDMGSAVTPGLWVLGIAVGTAGWFSGLAILSARLHGTLTAPRQRVVQQALSGLLAAGALLVLF
jgi:threonine/homoserine/homoserine lactone efflux protein